ncbi:hypothetical protein [Burkholderia sp. PU8-34]
MSDNEKFYDEEIAPALLEITHKLRTRGMSMVATVEYEPGSRGSTYEMPKARGFEMDLLRALSRAGNNVDAFLLSVIRMCDTRGIDYKGSIFLQRLAETAR